MRKGLIYILLAMGFIGVTIPLGGELMMKFPVWLFTCITIGVAAVIMIPIATLYEKTKWTKLGKKNYFGLFMQALLTCTLYTVFLLYGLTYASAISVGIITSIIPAVVFILAFFLLKEKLNTKKFISITLAVIAVLIMNIAGVQIGGGSNFLGILFMLLAVISLALFFIYAKKFAVELPPLTLAAGLCAWGFIQTLPMAVYEYQTFDASVITAGDWWGTFLYAILGWALAYAFTFLAMPTINASTAGMATAVMPIVAAVVALAFYGASIRTVDIIALILVIASIIIAESQEKSDTPSVTKEDVVEAK
ncbi:DMT family transporter [Salipaludibacillus sp. CF4.18]|uniref:DMT family transporter n=1 Tax=Salipaludibacillus sp. CF4.18 TaxID=3373081 RepID=UPI003EE466EA